MGVDYTAYAAIGVRVDPSRLKIKQSVRACKCDSPQSVFCSLCGKRYWRDVEAWVEGCTPTDETPEYFHGFPIAYTTDRKDMIICAAKVGTGYDNSLSGELISPRSVEEGLKSLRDTLEPLGLWSEPQLWAINYCSY